MDEHGVETLRHLARSLLPEQASAIEKAWETVNPVVLHGWTSFEDCFKYSQSGRSSCRSVLFINIGPGRQLRLMIDARAADFHSTVYRTLATWWEAGASEPSLGNAE